ncbi:hypothetical protein [Luteibacter aegosomatissinici]|uniref:hypothetical protein n=1 Tax=Luteibacter aegosomatissinici TaxID=2911539 RepID=UPI001FF824D4|nr:hypothetical protein [Luteibacter aegosomatissinici]UPG92808.1 hypothetical protein L2Y97_13130 [Luteibacter aegosomatissinici]
MDTLDSLKRLGYSATVAIALFGTSLLARASDIPAPTGSSPQILVDRAAAPIHSEDDLYRYTTLTPKAQSPLSLLSPQGQKRFLSSLKFNDNGLVGFNYADLRNELTPVQIYQVLSLFGAQRLAAVVAGPKTGPTEADSALGLVKPAEGVGDDYEGYACLHPHTCSKSINDICMRGC